MEENIMDIWKVVLEKRYRLDREYFYATEELADNFIKWLVSDFCKREKLSEDEVKYSDEGDIYFYNRNNIVATVYKRPIEVLTA